MLDRKTKIICTLGPQTADFDSLCKLIEAGMDAARLNFSHGSHSDHLDLIKQIRLASAATGKAIPIMQDLQGPKIRIGVFENGIAELKDGEKFIVTIRNIGLGNKDIISTNYTHITKDVKAGSNLLLDDGYIILYVDKVTDEDIFTTVVKGGNLKSNKGIICQGSSFSAPAMSDKDVQDLKFGLESGVDVVALSYVRSVRDIYELKTAMKIFGRIAPVIAKIERPEALDVIEEIIEEADAIMVARGDLGVEMPPEMVPIIQKDLIAKCNYHGKPVITATQMLESMITNPRPTRAEASDVANAVFDGTDCVMLSGETSVGMYPFDAVDYMSRIAKTVEKRIFSDDNYFKENFKPNTELADALGHASCIIAEQINAAAIVTLTTTTFTAKYISKYRPRIPIIGLTNDEWIQRRLNFVWGVDAVLISDLDLSSSIENIGEILCNKKYLNTGDYIVFVSGSNIGYTSNQNLIKIYQI